MTDTSSVNAIVGSRVRGRRLALGMSRRDLVAAAGLSVGNFLKLAAALRKPPQWFLRPLTPESVR